MLLVLNFRKKYFGGKENILFSRHAIFHLTEYLYLGLLLGLFLNRWKNFNLDENLIYHFIKF